MKKGIEQDDVPYSNYSWLAEHDYSSKYPINCSIFVEDDSEHDSETVINFRNANNCSTTDNDNVEADFDNTSSCESETSNDESSSDADESDKHVWPWMNIKHLDGHSDELVAKSFYEEHELLENLETAVKMIPNEKLDPSIYPLYSKLKLRHLKRSHGCQYFNFDNYLRSYAERKRMKKGENVGKTNSDKIIRTPIGILENTLLSKGVFPDLDYVSSQYTNRMLKPFIWRDFSCRPPFLKLLNEIKNKNCILPDENNIDCINGDSIDYSYLKSHHIMIINHLCCQYFWPGIDVTDTLQYPDFSCIALYKKLIVGFALMAPDLSPTETYLTFLFTRPQWRGSGIATFMIYHLIQTCMGKDITLHVAADNPAVLLYQKFGFKVEQFIHNFYDKYIPVDSRGCKHALYLRLSR